MDPLARRDQGRLAGITPPTTTSKPWRLGSCLGIIHLFAFAFPPLRQFITALACNCHSYTPEATATDPDSTIDILVRHVAFFGVTGLTVFRCLRHALEDPTLVCHVYVRNMPLLETMLESSGALSPRQVARMRIIQGDLGDMETTAGVLFPPALEGEPVHCIIYGIGGFRTWDVTDPQGSIDDSYVSEEAMYMLLAALQMGYHKFESKRKPRLVSIGTISISKQIYKSSNPLATKVRPLYEWFLGKEQIESNGSRHGLNGCGSISSDTSNESTITQLSSGCNDGINGNDSSEQDGSSNDNDSSSDAETSSSKDKAESMSSMEGRSPHADKSAMESIIWLEDFTNFSSCLVVRPTLLTYEQPYGL